MRAGSLPSMLSWCKQRFSLPRGYGEMKRNLHMKENQIRRQLISDFHQFARRMRLQYIYHDQNTEQHPFHVKSSWIPPILRSVALETYLLCPYFVTLNDVLSKRERTYPNIQVYNTLQDIFADMTVWCQFSCRNH